MEKTTQVLSVVVPCFNEEEVIQETYRRLTAKLAADCAAFGLRYELIFVDDGSSDKTLEILQQLCEAHEKTPAGASGSLSVLALARNFGHQLALSAGLDRATGDAIVAIDADLQDPPEVIEQMIRKWREGADVVYGVRSSREGESWFKLATANLFYRVLGQITKIDIPLDTGDFRLISRAVADTLRSMPERHRFIRGMIPWIGFRQESVHYERAARFAGETKYPFHKMLRLALDAVTSFSQAPLRVAYISGFVVAFISLLFAFYILNQRLRHEVPVQGWSSVMVAILFLGAVQLITVGILGEYIGRIYEQVKGRPLFIVDERKSKRSGKQAG